LQRASLYDLMSEERRRALTGVALEDEALALPERGR